MLELRNISKTFRGPSGEVHALADVSLQLAPGEFLAVQGPSGSGKTTLLLMAGGLLRPSSGAVLVDGCDPYMLSPEARARWRAGTIGFVFQQFHLLPYLTVLDNVRAATLARPREGADARARALVERLGLAARSSHTPGSLSVGERQRVALARALVNEPKLILADEPTGNLDPGNAKTVLDELAAFAGAGGAVLLVTHDRDAAGRAGRGVRLADGGIAGH